MPERADPKRADIATLARLFRQGALSPRELVEEMLRAIEAHDPRWHSFITVFAEESRRQADQATEELRRGEDRGPLHGVPIALKDLVYVAGTRTTCGSQILRDFHAPFDATVVTRLRKAGAILIGKTNLHEFAFGVTTENPHFGTTPNPWDRTRIAGGSSGGSSVALMKGFCTGALGTDTGGSIRIPSALCGHVGLKPTFGRVSVHGVVELAQSLDCIGPMARTVEDVALMLQVLAGYDPQDVHSRKRPVPDYRANLRAGVQGWRLGRPNHHFTDNLHPAVARAFDAACETFASLGAQIIPLDLPIASETHAAALPILIAEAYAFHAERLATQREMFGADVREMLERGEKLRAVDYVRAVRVRERAQREFARVFREVDLLLTPTVPIPAPPRADIETSGASESNRLRPRLTQNTRTFNLLGLPALSVPCGFSEEGLPIGLQLVGPKWSEARLLQAAYAYEQGRK